jgi:pectin methylesterase-like acyl-CoA thioesterase
MAQISNAARSRGGAAVGSARTFSTHSRPSLQRRCTIAVDAAPPRSTILVCPGTYTEQLVVTTSNLIIRGLDEERTVLRASALPVDPGSPAAGTPRKAIVLVNGATGVTLASLTIDGSAADGGATHFANCATVGCTLGI